MELTLKEVEVNKLNLSPGDIVVIKCQGESFTPENIEAFGQSVKNMVPFNRVMILNLNNGDSVNFDIVSPAEAPTQNYCSDCSCGKKEAYENKE